MKAEPQAETLRGVEALVEDCTTPPRWRVWTTLIHAYGGLFLSPFLVLFAISTILLNHAWKPWITTPRPDLQRVSLTAAMPDGLERLAQAKWVMQQLEISGEIEYLADQGPQLTIPIVKPGERIVLRADLTQGTVEVERTATDLWQRLIDLHKSPGPHLAGFRGNWVFTRIWGKLVDGTVLMTLLTTVTGIYLWLLWKPERRGGLVALGLGTLSLLSLLAALLH